MIVCISNKSEIIAEITVAQKTYEINAHEEITVDVVENPLLISVKPKLNSWFNSVFSEFVIKSTYSIQIEEYAENIIELTFETAPSNTKGKHTYKRFRVIANEIILQKFEITEPKKERKGALSVLGGSFLGVLLAGSTGSLIIAVAVGILASNVVAGIITYLVCIALVTIYEILEDVVLDKLFAKFKKRSSFLQKLDEIEDLEKCRDSNYIESCFNK